jgi:outer membrane lipopolysaccharide assembly protein LptE/RlpB
MRPFTPDLATLLAVLALLGLTACAGQFRYMPPHPYVALDVMAA